MLTKNFYNYMMARASKMTVTNGLLLPDGTVQNAGYYSSISSEVLLDIIDTLKKPSNTTITTNGVFIGTGVTPATAADSGLESYLMSGFSMANPSAPAISAETDHVSISATYSITNTGDTALAISEIGLFGNVYTGSGPSTTVVLLDRTVLEEPITINPGISKMLTYTIRFNYPKE